MGLDALKLLVDETAAVVVDVQDDGALADVVIQAALVGGVQQLGLPRRHFGHILAALQAHHCGGVGIDQPPDEGLGQVGHHGGVDLGGLMAEENAAQHRVRIKLLGVRLCDDKFPDGKACHAGVLVAGHLVQIAVGRFPFFCNTVCQLRALLLGHQRFVIEDISRTRQIAVDAVRRVIPCAGLVDHVQQVFHHSTSRAFSGMVARRMVEVIRPPVLQAGFVPLVGLLVLINVGCRFQHSFRYHRVIVVAQVSHQGHLIHVHGINEPLPRDVRIQLLIIG